jgi:tetratricopeptide (TPR) repeat protein
MRAISAYQTLFRIYNEENKQAWGGYAALRQLNIAAENLGPSPELVRAYTIMGIMTGLLNFQTLAETYFVKAAKIVEQLSHTGNLRAMIWRGSAVYQVGSGKFSAVQDETQRAIDIFDRLGDKNSWRDCMAILGTTYYYTGDFKQSAQTMEKLAASGADSEVFLQKIWALIWQGASFMRLGRLDEGVNLLTKASELLGHQDNGLTDLSCWGLLAVACWRRGDVEAAWEAADKAVELIAQTKSLSGHPFSLDGHAGVAEFYFALRETNNFEPFDNKKIAMAIRQAVKSLQDYARRYAIGQPSAYLYQGLYDWRQNKQQKAEKAWHKGLAVADQLGMRYEKGRLVYELGRHLPAGNPNRRECLLRAQEIFEQLDAGFDLILVRKAMA